MEPGLLPAWGLCQGPDLPRAMGCVAKVDQDHQGSGMKWASSWGPIQLPQHPLCPESWPECQAAPARLLRDVGAWHGAAKSWQWVRVIVAVSTWTFSFRGLLLGTPSPNPRAWQRDVGRTEGKHLPQAGTARPQGEGSQLHSYTPERGAGLEPFFTPQIYGPGPCQALS